MPSSTALNFPVGSFVEADFTMTLSNGFIAKEIGTVVGLTVNLCGDPILMVNLIRRKIPDLNMCDIGYEPLRSDTTHTFWERTVPVHPANLRMLNSATVL